MELKIERAYQALVSRSNDPTATPRSIIADFSPDSQEPTEEAHLQSGQPHQSLDFTAARRRTRLDWDNVHVHWTLARWRTVLFSVESGFQLYHADCRVCVWRRVGERYAEAIVLRRVAHGGGSVMWAGICHGECTHLHFINANLNAQCYRDEILRAIVVPFVELHHVTFQQDHARPHIARICRNFLE
ncbi:hypothetical protein WMY93_007567 [Mugilogobius chulae]|uniref:Transposase n=1 Tax=Mugilogobius chulae TaxID=88201 RepID=A0AAW0PIH9_9GOBI